MRLTLILDRLLRFFVDPRNILAQPEGGLVPDGGVSGVPVTSSSAPAGGGGWLDGVYEANFVAVSVIVGAVLTLALVYLIRRLIPKR